MLACLGAVCGMVSGLVMVLFHTIIYWPVKFFSEAESDSFSVLPVEWRISLVLLSCFILALLFSVIPSPRHKVGVPFVVERLNTHRGSLPIGNAVMQFFTAVIALVGGLSVGKEGPAVHIGATVGGYLADKAKLQQYGKEALLACGVAGAISAIFQTPLAGGLFAFEVIFLEYQQRYVLPVLTSSVVAALVSHYLLGPLSIFSIQSLSVLSFSPELFFACLVLVAFIIVLSVVFIYVQKAGWCFGHSSVWLRFGFVALLSVIVAVWMPEALSSGYDVLAGALLGELALYSLFSLILVKIVLTAATVGLGIPGGMIGPTFIIGGLAGVLVASVFGQDAGDLVLFALLGMTAMMAACFQAPLTALIAIIEMTHSSQVIVPALMVIVLVCLIMRGVLHIESLFVERLKYTGMTSSINPFQRYLRHHSVAPVAEHVLVLPMQVSLSELKKSPLDVIHNVAFKKADTWRLVSSNELLASVQADDIEKQLWFEVEDMEAKIDLSRALSSNSVSCIIEPSSLEVVLDWFRETGEQKVLVSFSSAKLCLVTRKRLDEFLLASD